MPAAVGLRGAGRWMRWGAAGKGGVVKAAAEDEGAAVVRAEEVAGWEGGVVAAVMGAAVGKVAVGWVGGLVAVDSVAVDWEGGSAVDTAVVEMEVKLGVASSR